MTKTILNKKELGEFKLLGIKTYPKALVIKTVNCMILGQRQILDPLIRIESKTGLAKLECREQTIFPKIGAELIFYTYGTKVMTSTIFYRQKSMPGD